MKSARPITAASLLLALLASGCAISVTTNGDSTSARTSTLPGSAKFECVQSPSGECHYALYTSRCQSVEGDAGKRATTCTHQVFEEFTLASGKTREFRELPKGYKQCMKPVGRPEVPNCD